MKAWFVTRFGPPEVLKMREVPIPEPGPDEIRVRVKAIGLNFADVMARLGVYPSIPEPPFVPGIEFTGVVDAVGQGQTDFALGDSVVAFSRQGAYAEFVCVPACQAFAINPSIPPKVAAALAVTYLTAYHGMKTLANIQQGERMLLHAAAGGVGTAALQIAKYLGVESIATAGSPEKLEVARSYGAACCIDYRKENFADVIRAKYPGDGLDVVMDSVGGRLFRPGWNLLAPMGRYILYGFASVSGPSTINRMKAVREFLAVKPLYPPVIVSQNKLFAGFNLYFLVHKTVYLKRALAEIFGWHRDGIITPVVGRTFAFDEIPAAQAFLQSRASIGKIVVQL